MKTLLSKEELQIQFQTTDFVLKTQKQIAKDFYSSGLSFNNSFELEELIYMDIISAIQVKVEEIIQQGERQLLQLLYQIDIPQSQFLALVNEEEFSLKLSEVILRREAYKVFLRTKF